MHCRDGEFKLFINSSDKICGVHLLHHGYLATDNLARLAGLHVSTFPGLDTAEDLAAFFQQPKFQAVFHEDFHNLRRQIRAAVLGRQVDSRYGLSGLVLLLFVMQHCPGLRTAERWWARSC